MDKDFTTFEKQIEILKSRNLKFVNEEAAMKALQRFGYYNIINGYKDPYVEKINGQECYRDDVTFEQLYSLYITDRKISSHLMTAMLEIEDNLRTAVAHTLGEVFSADQHLYLDRNNYRSGAKRNGSYQIDEILKKFQKISQDDIQPMRHYRETYNNIPPWILLKGASFGNLVNFIKLQKGPQKDKIVSLIYDIPLSMVNTFPPLKDLFMDTLFVCLDYRNRAAHGGRIYNFRSKAEFRFTPLLHGRANISEAEYRLGIGKTGISTLCKAISLMDNQNPYITLRFALEYFLDDHCNLYPADREYLQKYLSV